MNPLFNWLAQVSHNKVLLQRADEIATECQHEVRQHVWAAGMKMNQSQARGYVRVYARKAVRRRLGLVRPTEKTLAPQQHSKLMELAVQRLVSNVVAEFLVIQLPPASRRRVA